VIGEDPVGASNVQTSAPAHFTLTIPSDIDSCEPYMLAAVGATSSGQYAESDTILLTSSGRTCPPRCPSEP